MAAKKTELTCNMFQFAYEKKTTQLQKLKHLRLQLAEVNAFYTNGIIELHQSGCGLSNTESVAVLEIPKRMLVAAQIRNC